MESVSPGLIQYTWLGINVSYIIPGTGSIMRVVLGLSVCWLRVEELVALKFITKLLHFLSFSGVLQSNHERYSVLYINTIEFSPSPRSGTLSWTSAWHRRWDRIEGVLVGEESPSPPPPLLAPPPPALLLPLSLPTPLLQLLSHHPCWTPPALQPPGLSRGSLVL